MKYVKNKNFAIRLLGGGGVAKNLAVTPLNRLTVKQPVGGIIFMILYEFYYCEAF